MIDTRTYDHNDIICEMKILTPAKLNWNLPATVFGVIFMLLFISGCRSPYQLISIKTKLLKFNEMYVYDNGKDTIIKDYDMYKKILDTHLIEITPLTQSDTFAPAQGSTFLESIMFYQDGTCDISSHFLRDYKKLYEDHQFAKNKKHDPFPDFKITDDGNISFTHGTYTKGIFIYYSGRVSNDTLYLKLSYQPTNHSFTVTDFHVPSDSLRIYVLHPFTE